MRTGTKNVSKKDLFFHDDLKQLLDYVYRDEQKHYMDCPSRNHIYPVIRRLAKHIGYIREGIS